MQVDNSKSYASSDEEQKRFQIFQDNLKFIKDHNKKYEAGQTTYKLGINEFTDMTNEEFGKTHFGFGAPKP